MSKPKKKHPIFIPDPNGTKIRSIFDVSNTEESKQRDLEQKLRFKAK